MMTLSKCRQVDLQYDFLTSFMNTDAFAEARNIVGREHRRAVMQDCDGWPSTSSAVLSARGGVVRLTDDGSVIYRADKDHHRNSFGIGTKLGTSRYQR